VVRLECKPVMGGIPWEHVTRDFCSVTTLQTLLESFLKDSVSTNEVLPEAHLEKLFVMALAWAVGGLLEIKDRVKVHEVIIAEGGEYPDFGEETIYELMVNPEDAQWVHWNTRVPEWAYPVAEEKPRYAELVIPTLDSVRYEFLLGSVSAVSKASLLVGGPGTAKTTAIMQFIATFDPEAMVSKSITFSSLTTPNIFQFSVEGAVEKRQGRTFGPPGGKKMMLFVDDLSMPSMNDWGDQTTNEIVRQLLEVGGMYALEKPIGDMKYVVDVLYTAAMSTPGGGKNDIPNRLKRQFCSFYTPLPAVAAINNIFGALVRGRFDSLNFDEETVEGAQKLVPMTVGTAPRGSSHAGGCSVVLLSVVGSHCSVYILESTSGILSESWALSVLASCTYPTEH
jgi:dynein heavy chain